jgi:hypothetical protein
MVAVLFGPLPAAGTSTNLDTPSAAVAVIHGGGTYSNPDGFGVDVAVGQFDQLPGDDLAIVDGLDGRVQLYFGGPGARSWSQRHPADDPARALSLTGIQPSDVMNYVHTSLAARSLGPTTELAVGDPAAGTVHLLNLPGRPFTESALTVSATPGALSCPALPWYWSSQVTYAWLRDGALIAGATASTHAITSADTSHDLACRQRASGPGGTTTLLSASMHIAKDVSPVVPGPTTPAPTARPAWHVRVPLTVERGRRAGGSWVPARRCTIIGTPRADHLVGTSGADVICGLGGNDRIEGLGGNDIIDGGAGNDVINGGAGNDQILGLAGNDRIVGGPGRDRISGGAGRDRIDGGSGADTIDGGSASDRINGGSGSDRIWGRAGNDRITGSRGNDHISGGPGNDHIAGGSGNDRLLGDAGRDLINAGPGADQIHGGAGPDTLLGAAGNDLLWGETGNDRMLGGSGKDWLVGGAGNDVLYGGSGADRLVGGAGDDRIWGNSGADLLAGAAGDDLLVGGSGPDRLWGGTGVDRLVGGPGADCFVRSDEAAGSDRAAGIDSCSALQTLGAWLAVI